MNKDAIVHLALSNDTSKLVFESLASRERDRKMTDVYTLRDRIVSETGSKVSPGEWMQTFKELEKLGIGKFVGERSFKWNYSLRSVGAAATASSKPTQRASLHERRIVVDLPGDVVITVTAPKAALNAEQREKALALLKTWL